MIEKNTNMGTSLKIPYSYVEPQVIETPSRNYTTNSYMTMFYTPGFNTSG